MRGALHMKQWGHGTGVKGPVGTRDLENREKRTCGIKFKQIVQLRSNCSSTQTDRLKKLTNMISLITQCLNWLLCKQEFLNRFDDFKKSLKQEYKCTWIFFIVELQNLDKCSGIWSVTQFKFKNNWFAIETSNLILTSHLVHPSYKCKGLALANFVNLNYFSLSGHWCT